MAWRFLGREIPALRHHGTPRERWLRADERAYVSARLQEEEAEFANRHGSSKHKPALPLYTEDDARAALKQFEVMPTGEDFSPWPGWSWRHRSSARWHGA